MIDLIYLIVLFKRNIMASLNKVMVIGNLGKDPELRYTADGMAMANFYLATTSSWKDKTTGEKKEETEWHKIVFYGKIAEVIGQYAKKGKPLYVEGRLKTRKWTDKDGVEKYTTEIIGEQMQLLGNRDGINEPNNTPNMPHNSSQYHQNDDGYPNTLNQNNRITNSYTPTVNPIIDDDIPF